MSLTLNEENQLLQDSAKKFLSEKAPISAFRKIRDENNENGFSKTLWQEMVEMGWVGIAIQAQFGGLEFGYTGLGVILEQIGHTLTLSPMSSTVLTFATAIQLAGKDKQKEKNSAKRY